MCTLSGNGTRFTLVLGAGEGKTTRGVIVIGQTRKCSLLKKESERVTRRESVGWEQNIKGSIGTGGCWAGRTEPTTAPEKIVPFVPGRKSVGVRLLWPSIFKALPVHHRSGTAITNTAHLRGRGPT